MAVTWLWLTIFTFRASARGNKRVWSTSFAHATSKPSQSHMKYINRPSAAFTSGSRASSFVSNEQDPTATPQVFGSDFESQSQEHWQNVHHTRNASDNSGSFYSEPHSYQQQNFSQQKQPYYQQQQPYYQQQQQHQQQVQPGGYYFGGQGGGQGGYAH